MSILRVLAALAVLFAPANLICSSRVLAQDAGSAEAVQAANELVALLSKDMLNQMATQMTAQFWPLIERDLGAKIDAATLAQLRSEFERIQIDNLSDVLQDAPAIYARYFTAAELRELNAFYHTPTGQKALRELPKVLADSVATMVPRLQEVQKKTQEAFVKVLRDRGYNP
jgi:uncharacterized protein